MEATPADVAEYIKTLCSELAGLADQAGLTTLNHLLVMCVDEAESQRASLGDRPKN
jgi:hypothetical protein